MIWIPGQKPLPGVPINPAQSAAKGMVAAWLFNRKPGKTRTAYDLVGGNDATLILDAQSVPTIFGPGIDFDGNGDNIQTTYGPATDLNETFTFSVVFNGDNITGTGNQRVMGSIAEKGAFDPVADIGFLNSTGRLFFRVRGDGGGALPTATTPSALANDTWYHVFGVRTSSSIELYVNGFLSASTADTSSGDVDLSSFPVYLGADNVRGGAGGFLNGQLDHVIIYNRALSPTEIASLSGDPFQAWRPDPFELWTPLSISPPASGDEALMFGSDF